MGHAGMAATAVRYLRSVGSATSVTHPPPGLRAVREDERAPLDPAEFRRILGSFATGVTVITAAGADRAEPAGFACQSFASLSLDPPLVTFMVARTSTTWPRIARAGGFCVNILAAGQDELCRDFAVSGADKFAGVTHSPAPVTGAPLLDGVAGWIDCVIQAVHPGGDHLIVVGRVRALGDSGVDASPLLFHKGTFGGFRPVHRDS